jgi:glycosyltransferase involved in cell wall biosynthesis
MIAPRFTVVIPTYNRPAQLTKCLEAVARLEPPGAGFEVCIVNDGGTAPPRSAIEAARAGRAVGVNVIDRKNSGPAAARNAGALGASGEYVAFLDDDCRPTPAWLQALDLELRRNPEALVTGPTVNAVAKNLYSAASQLLVDFVAAYFAERHATRFAPSSNLAVLRTNFLAAGMFDENFSRSAGEDREFVDRWWRQKRPLVVSSSAVVYHEHVLTWRSFVRQHSTYGRGAATFRRLQRAHGRPQQIDPRFYLNSVKYPFQRERLLLAVPIAALIALAHGAYVAGLFAESMQAIASGNGSRLPPEVPVQVRTP